MYIFYSQEVEQVQSEFERIWVEGMFPGWPVSIEHGLVKKKDAYEYLFLYLFDNVKQHSNLIIHVSSP